MIRNRFFSIFCICILIFTLVLPVSAEIANDPDLLVSLNVQDLPFDTSDPWCVRFARWVCNTYYDIPLECLSPSDSCTWSIRWFSGNGQDLQHFPSIGAWIYYDWEQDGTPDHVGVVTDTDGYNIKTIEGNVNDAIFSRTITLDDSRVFGFNTPVFRNSQIKTSISASSFHSPNVFVNVVAPVDPSETSGFKAVLLGLIGSYDPVVTEHRYTNSNGYTSISIDIQPDYVWWASAAMIAICLWSIFRLIGGLIKR